MWTFLWPSILPSLLILLHIINCSDTVAWLTCKDPVKSSPTTNQHTKHLQVQCPCCHLTNCVRALCLLIELYEINHDVITFIYLLILHSFIFILFFYYQFLCFVVLLFFFIFIFLVYLLTYLFQLLYFFFGFLNINQFNFSILVSG